MKSQISIYVDLDVLTLLDKEGGLKGGYINSILRKHFNLGEAEKEADDGMLKAGTEVTRFDGW